MTRYLLLVAACAVFSCKGNHSKPPKQTPGTAGKKSVDFRSSLPRFVKILEPEIQPRPLLKDDAFIAIAKNATAYVPDALEVLSDPSVPEEEKHVAVLAMEGLPFQPFLGFLRSCYGLVLRGAMKEGLLSVAMVPSTYFDNGLRDRFREEDAQRLLREMEQDTRLSANLRDTANAFRTGRIDR